MLGIEHHRDHFLTPEAQQHAEVIALVGKSFRTLHVRGIVVSVMVVVLENPKRVVQCRARNENDSCPMMNEPVGTLDGLSAIAHVEPVDCNATSANSRIGSAAFFLGPPVG